MKQLFFVLLLSLQLLSSEGEEIYNRACISCHANLGESDNKIHLLVKPRKLNRTILNYDQSFAIIKEGAHYWGAHSDIMPSFKYLLTDKQIHIVTRYIAKKFNPEIENKIDFFLNRAVKLSKEEKKNRLILGKKTFLKSCALCHGINGDAKSEYVTKSKEDKSFIYPYNLTRTLLSEKQIFLYAKYGGHFWGTAKDDMPAWGKRYNDVTLKSVAHYIQKKIKKLD